MGRPAGFFENADAEAKARGEAPKTKRSKEEEYADFMVSIAADVKEVEEREQEEAVDAAQERADREAFEQRQAPLHCHNLLGRILCLTHSL